MPSHRDMTGRRQHPDSKLIPRRYDQGKGWICLCEECGEETGPIKACRLRDSQSGRKAQISCFKCTTERTHKDQRIDRAGETYGRLRALRRDPKKRGYWFFQCAPDLGGCGKEKSIFGANVWSKIKDKPTRSCGCLLKDAGLRRRGKYFPPRVINPQMLPQPKGHFIYCYLRAKSDIPYYIGQGGRPDRMTGRHSCSVPKDRTRIRVLKEGLTQEEANYWEGYYIKKYGRKDLGNDGVLRNLKDGGKEGKNISDESRKRISLKVKQLHKTGVFDKMNAPEVIAQRKAQRMYNLATRLGIDGEQYLNLPRTKREQLKEWLKDNPGKSIEDWEDTLKAARAAEKYHMSLEDWNKLANKQKNSIKEFCNRFPELNRTGEDWLRGERAKMGPKREFGIEEMVDLQKQGLNQAQIAKKLGCNPCHVSRSLKKWRCQQKAQSLV